MISCTSIRGIRWESCGPRDRLGYHGFSDLSCLGRRPGIVRFPNEGGDVAEDEGKTESREAVIESWKEYGREVGRNDGGGKGSKPDRIVWPS